MKCKDCDACHKVEIPNTNSSGYYYYECRGVKNPFKINDINQECTEYKSNKAEHTFKFKTYLNWKPMTLSCWADCPFSLFIPLGERCPCIKGEYPCPFTNKNYDFDGSLI